MITKIFSWGNSATLSDAPVSLWLAGLALVLILSFLWSTVVRQTVAEF